MHNAPTSRLKVTELPRPAQSRLSQVVLLCLIAQFSLASAASPLQVHRYVSLHTLFLVLYFCIKSLELYLQLTALFFIIKFLYKRSILSAPQSRTV